MRFLWVLFNLLLNLTVLCKNMCVPHLCKRFLSCAYLILTLHRAQQLLKLFPVLNIVKATHSWDSTVAKRNNALNLLGLQQFLFLLLY